MPIKNGDVHGIPAAINHNAKMAELLAKYGSCDMFAVADGFEIAAADKPLTVTVSPGHAFGESLIESAEEKRVVLWDDGVNFLWLRTSGVVEAVFDSITPPGLDAVYLGAVRVESGAVVGISTLGRFSLRAGNVVRHVDDEGIPGDADSLPESPSWFYTVSQSGIWLWDGSRYWKVGA